jgi:hypothetical protein
MKFYVKKTEHLKLLKLAVCNDFPLIVKRAACRRGKIKSKLNNFISS